MNQTVDPRADLAAYTGATQARQFAAAEFARFYELAPSVQTELLKAWYARGQNFITAYVQAEAGAVLARHEQPDEYVVLVPDADTPVEIVRDGVASQVPGASIAFVPGGAASSVRVLRPGRVLLLYTTRSTDLCDLCVNASAYATPHPNIPRFQSWPEPAGALQVRHYSLEVADEPGRFGRIWRGSTFMVNFLAPQHGPRDVTKLSPHHHDDFEQGSFAFEGSFTHHIRWPWTADMNAWRQDEHALCASPSLAVIPPPAIHTSRGMEEGINQLIDIFSPPRMDFSRESGWVLNADDYPLPQG